jgi:hypothetical protein
MEVVMVSDSKNTEGASVRRTFPAAVVDAVSDLGDRRATRREQQQRARNLDAQSGGLASIDSGRRFGGAEFWLVVIMLLVLSALVLAVLFSPPIVLDVESQDGQATVAVEDRELVNDVFEYRRTILAVIITAFGAWVGAGAAYFFGRENLREATRNMLQMREPSAKDRLRKTPVREIPPLPLDWRPTEKAKLKEVHARLTERPDYWFIPVFDDKGGLVTVLEEEAFWRYLYDICGRSEIRKDADSSESKASSGPRSETSISSDRTSAPTTMLESSEPEPTDELLKKTLGEAIDTVLKRSLEDLVKHVKQDRSLRSEFYDIFVPCTMDQSAADVYRKMQLAHRDLRLAIVFDESGKPTHFFTTTEVRRLLLDIF